MKDTVGSYEIDSKTHTRVTAKNLPITSHHLSEYQGCTDRDISNKILHQDTKRVIQGVTGGMCETSGECSIC